MKRFTASLFLGENKEALTIFTPRNPVQLEEDMVRWFGGRADACSATPPLITATTEGGKAPDGSFTRDTRSDLT